MQTEMISSNKPMPNQSNKRGTGKKGIAFFLKRDIYLYLLLLLPVAYYIVFMYVPMYGVTIAFKNYNIFKGILRSEWVGFDVFKEVFRSRDFWVAFKNTLVLNILGVIVGFPGPIILAIMLNEVKKEKLRSFMQATVYLPHFLSWVVVSGIFIMLLSSQGGLVNTVLESFGIKPIPFMMKRGWWICVYLLTGIWKEIGWNSIIYMAAITNIDPALYEASYIDGANKWNQIWHITLSGIKPTIVLLLILKMGNMLSIGFEQPFMMGNSAVSDVSEVISTHVYVYGLQNNRYSYATAVGLFQSVLNFILLVSVNFISKKVSEEGIW